MSVAEPHRELSALMPSVTSRYLIICIGAVLMGSTALTSLSWSQQVGSDRALSEGDDAIFSDGNFDPFGDGQEQDGDPNSTDFDDEESLERDEEPRRSDFEQNAIDQLNNRQQRADGNQSARPAQQVGLIQPDGSVRTLANSRVRPVQGRAVPNDDDPYAALAFGVENSCSSQPSPKALASRIMLNLPATVPRRRFPALMLG